MRTWVAALAHIGLAAAQAAVGVPFLNNNTTGGVIGNTGIQFGAQFGLTVLQAWLAARNSHTDPTGKPLIQTINAQGQPIYYTDNTVSIATGAGK